jgi:hypothetical protein
MTASSSFEIAGVSAAQSLIAFRAEGLAKGYGPITALSDVTMDILTLTSEELTGPVEEVKSGSRFIAVVDGGLADPALQELHVADGNSPHQLPGLGSGTFAFQTSQEEIYNERQENSHAHRGIHRGV